MKGKLWNVLTRIVKFTSENRYVYPCPLQFCFSVCHWVSVAEQVNKRRFGSPVWSVSAADRCVAGSWFCWQQSFMCQKDGLFNQTFLSLLTIQIFFTIAWINNIYPNWKTFNFLSRRMNIAAFARPHDYHPSPFLRTLFIVPSLTVGAMAEATASWVKVA